MTRPRPPRPPVEVVGWAAHGPLHPDPERLVVRLRVDAAASRELVHARLAEAVRDLAAELDPAGHPDLAVEVTQHPDGTATAYLGGAADDELLLDPGRTFPITLALDRDDHTRESALQLAAGLRALVRVLDRTAATPATPATPATHEEAP